MMGTAVVRELKLSRAVTVMHIAISMAAPILFRDPGCHRGNCFIGTAMKAGVMNKGKAGAACQN
jgi:hypothetical protein